MKKQNLFRYSAILEPICEKITNHKFCKLIGWTHDFVDRNFKYPNRSDFYYKCKICGYVFFNHQVTKQDLEKIKNWEKQNEKKDVYNK